MRITPLAKPLARATPRCAVIGLVCAWLCSGINAWSFPPQITLQPTNQSVLVGGSAAWAVQATSSTTLSYQWYFQAGAIPQATNNYYAPTNLQTTDAGVYYVAVTNADGGLYSSNAFLTVGNNPGLKGHWKLDADANDFSGNNYHGTLTNGAAIDTNSATANIGAGKVSLDGVNDYVDLSAHRSTFATMNQGTIAAWIKTPDADGTIFDVSDLAVANSYGSFWLYQGTLTFTVGINPQVVLDVSSTATVNDNAWHHVAVSVDASGNKLYIDGVQQTSLVYFKGNPATQKFFSDVPGIDFMAIGIDRNNAGLRDALNGLVDDVRVYYGALSASDIASLATQRGADVTTTVSGPTSVFATTNFTYTIGVTNLGFDTATNVVVSNTLPAGLNVVGVSGGGILVGGGPGQVVFDRASSNHTSGTLSWTHVTTNATNRLMMVGVSFVNSILANHSGVTALTYGGVNLSKVLARTNNLVSTELWQLVNPPSGTNTITITQGGVLNTMVAGAVTFSGVDQSTPLSVVASAATSSGNSISTPISSATNEIVFDNVAFDKNGNPQAGTAQTELWDIRGLLTGAGFASMRPGTNSVNMSWTHSSGDSAQVAVSVKPAGLIGVVSWSIPKLTNKASTNFTVTVTAPLSGTLTNSVTSTAATTDPVAANNNGTAGAAQVVTTVIPVADVITTLSGPVSIATLTNYAYTVTVSNQGPSTASNVLVSETLAPTLTFVSATAGGTYLAGVITWPALASLAKGATTNFTVTVRSPLSGTLTNSVASSATSSDPNPANNNGSAPAAQVVTAVSPLQIANTSFGANVQTLNWSHTIAPGSSRILIVGVSIDNTNATVNAATFNNILPLTLIGQTNGAQTKVLMYRLLNPPSGTYAVSINLNSAVGVVGGACSFNGVDQANPITSFVGNSGAGTNTSVTVTSSLGDVVIDAVAPKSPQNAINPGVAQTAEWNLSASNYSGAGSSSHGATTVTPTWSLNSPTNWTAAAVALKSATVLADVTVSVTGPTSVLATSNMTYAITVTNLGSATATNVVVSHVVPAGAIFVSASSGGTTNGGVVTWPTLANLVNGARTNYTVTLTAPAAGTLTNIVYSTAFTADPDPSNNNGTSTGNQVTTTVTPLADVTTTVVGPASVLARTDFSYTLTTTNAGPSSASNIVVTDTLPAGAIFVSASADGVHSAGMVTWSVANLASGATTNFIVTVTAPTGGSLFDVVTSTSSATDLVPANNDGSDPAAQVLTSVTPVADITTTVTGPVMAITNTPFSYTIVVTNSGPSDATGVVVSNRLPAGITYVSASSSGLHAAGVVTWLLASLPSGSATNFDVTAFAPAVGTLTNTVSSSAGSGDPDLSNNDGTAGAAQAVTEVYPFLVLIGQTLPSGGFQVEFHSFPDTSLAIEATTNLVDWINLITTNSGVGHVIFVDPDAASYPQRFYRIHQGP